MYKVKFLKTLQAYDGASGDRKLSTYSAGETYTIGESLYLDLVNDGAVELVDGDVENRETKVDGPEEFKIEEFTRPQLVEFAKENFGLVLKGNLSKDKMLEEIQAKIPSQD